MPLSVGDVYIDIRGDAKPFERDLRQALAKVDRRFRLDKGLQNLLNDRQLGQQVDLLAQRWGRALAAQSRKGLAGVTPKIDLSEVRRDLQQIAQDTGADIEKVEKQFLGNLNRAIDQANKEYTKGLEERARYWLGVSKEAAKIRERQEREANRQAERAARLAERQRAANERAADTLRNVRLTELVNDLRDTEALTARVSRAFSRLQTATQANRGLITATRREAQLREQIAQATADGEEEVALKLERQRVLVGQLVTAYQKRIGAVSKANRDLFTFDRGAFRAIDRGLTRIRFGLRRAGTGGFFDAFTNFLAIGPGVIRTFTRLGSKITTFPIRGLEAIGTGIQKIGIQFGSKALANAGARIAGIAAALGPLGTAIGAIIGATAGLFVLIKGLGILASGLSVTVGAFTILGSALLFAAGSVAAFIPLVASLPLALGTVAAAFKGVGPAISAYAETLSAANPEELAEAQEKYNEALAKLEPNARDAVRALQPVIRQFSELQNTVQQEVFAGIDEEIKALQPLFDTVVAGVEQTAGTINNILKDISSTFQEPAFLDDLENVFENLQPILEDLGSAAGDFIAGFTGLIDALTPSAKNLSGNIKDIAENFKEFTQSESGKNKIKEFMEKAEEAAGKVLGILENIGGALGTLFGGAEDEGQTFLDKVLVKTQEFEDWVNRIVEDGTLDRWLADAEEAMSAFADVIGAVADAFDALDTEANRQLFSDILGGVAGFFDWATEVIDFFNSPDWQGFTDVIVEPIVAALEILAQIPSIIPGFGAIGDAARNALTTIENVREAAERPPETGTASWTDSLLSNLTGIVEEGGLTRTQLEEIFLVANTEGVTFAPGLLEDLALLTLEGKLTEEEFQKIVGEKVPPGWPTDFVGLLSALIGEGELTVGQLQDVLADQTLPTWVREGFLNALSGIIAEGQLTDEQMRTLLGDKNLPSWLASELEAALNRGTTAAGETDTAVRGIPKDWDVNINVTDNGSAAAVNSNLDGFFFGKSYTIPVNIAAPPGAARGGLFRTPTTRLIGEAGPEAVIPLTRPLSEVDPSVRNLARLIRGQATTTTEPSPTVAGLAAVPTAKGTQKTVNVTMNVYPSQADPEAVAEAVMNRAVVLAR